jgi:hypothetical protein
MFEGIILITFFIIGGLTSLLAVFFFVLAIVRGSRAMFKIGLGIAIVPLSLYALTYWFYDIHIPKLNKQVKIEYVGTYVLISTNGSDDMGTAYKTQTKLVLKTDNTFWIDKNDFMSFYGEGTWKAGATDNGQFEFKDKRNSIVFWAEPLDSNRLKIDKNFNDRQQVVFVK